MAIAPDTSNRGVCSSRNLKYSFVIEKQLESSRPPGITLFTQWFVFCSFAMTNLDNRELPFLLKEFEATCYDLEPIASVDKLRALYIDFSELWVPLNSCRVH